MLNLEEKKEGKKLPLEIVSLIHTKGNTECSTKCLQATIATTPGSATIRSQIELR